MRVYHHTKADYMDYTKRLKAWGNKYGMKFIAQEFEEKAKSHSYNFKDIR